MIDLKCSSMCHVIDRAKAFLFCDPPYKVIAVKPDGFVLNRPDSRGVKGETLYVKLAGRDVQAWNIATDLAINSVIAEEQAKRCKPPAKCFIDEVNDSPVKPMTEYASELLRRFPRR